MRTAIIDMVKIESDKRTITVTSLFYEWIYTAGMPVKACMPRKAPCRRDFFTWICYDWSDEYPAVFL